MRKQSVILLLSFVLTLFGFSISFEDYVFYNDFDTGFEVADILDKNVLLIFTSSSCPYCSQLKDVIASENVMNFLINNYILIEIRADEDKTAHFDVENARFDKDGKAFSYGELFSLFGVRGVPASHFFNRKQEYLGGLPGYLPKQDFLNWLKFVETESYKEMEIKDFEMDANYNGTLQVKAIQDTDLSKLENYLPELLTYYTYNKFKEMNLITTNPFKYYIIREAKVKDVQKYLENLDKKLIYSVYVLE